jgi:3-methyladenine DNA glycosylase AlkD
MSSLLTSLKKELRALGTPERARLCAWFFKTAPGQYGEGDIFIGITVPAQRATAKKYGNLSLSDIEKLLQSQEHEFRLTALILLVAKYKQAERSNSKKSQKQIFSLYLKNTKSVNNWDLVDSSASYIVGTYLATCPATERMRTLMRLAKSKLLWDRRIAMISTLAFISKGHHAEAIAIATILVDDKHELIQKAVGWMLREIGKRASLEAELSFLHKYGATMPRTTLRYAIEKFPKHERQMYLALRHTLSRTTSKKSPK